jgi:hypothetical protein
MLDEGGLRDSQRDRRCGEHLQELRESRILRLAPDLDDVILADSKNRGMMLDQLERPLPASWEEQRRSLSSRDRLR